MVDDDDDDDDNDDDDDDDDDDDIRHLVMLTATQSKYDFRD